MTAKATVITGTDPQSIKELEALFDENNGALTPQELVNAARSPLSALHAHFTWDDSEAAEKYRLWEARRFLGKLKVTITVPEQPKSITTRAVISVVGEDKQRRFRRTTDVLSSADMARNRLRDLLRDVQAIQRRLAEWPDLTEHSDMFDPIIESIEKQIAEV